MSQPSTDLPRLLAVSAAFVLCLYGSLLGSGVLGGPAVSEAADGALAADATLIAPAGPAFTIWSLIYLGLAAYAVWQWFPAARAQAARHAAVGWWIAGSMVLNAAWLLSVRAGLIWLSVAVIVALVAVLGMAVRALVAHRSESLADRVVTDTTVGLYIGWVSVATCANVTAALVDSGVDPGEVAGEWGAIAVLAVAGAVGVALVRAAGSSAFLAGGAAAALVWGISWIAIARWTDLPESPLVAGVAAVVALAVAGFAISRLSRGSSPARAPMQGSR